MDRQRTALALSVGWAATGCLRPNPDWADTMVQVSVTSGATLAESETSDPLPLTTTGEGTTIQGSTDAGTSSSDGGDETTQSTGSRYADIVLSDGPVAYWRLDEIVPPTAADLGPHGYDGTYAGSIVYEVPGPLCNEPDNLAKRLNGGNSVITMGNVLGFSGSAPYSIELWLLLDPQSNGGLIAKTIREPEPGEGALGYYLTVHYQSDDDWRIRLNRPPSGSANATEFPVEVWFHLVAIWDGASTNSIYINGELAASRVVNAEPPEGLPEHEGPFRIGDADAWPHIDATVDEVAVYDYPLPLSRIMAHYTAGTDCPDE